MELKEVFEPVFNIVKNFQKKEKEPASKQAAKDRLKLVLMQDRASVSPDFFDMMKKELIDVIKKYIEIDEESLDVQLTRGMEVGLEGPALYANIPIKNVKPVAPQGESDEDGMTEEKADLMAEEILNQIEEVAKLNAEEKAVSQAEEVVEAIKEEPILQEAKEDELLKFAKEGIQAVRAELDLPQTEEIKKEETPESTEVIEKAEEVEKKVAKKKNSTKKTSKKKVAE